MAAPDHRTRRSSCMIESWLALALALGVATPPMKVATRRTAHTARAMLPRHTASGGDAPPRRMSDPRRLEPQRLRDDVLLDLGGPAVDRRHEGGVHVAHHRVLLGVAVAAHDLHALERALLRELGAGQLRHRGLLR